MPPSEKVTNRPCTQGCVRPIDSPDTTCEKSTLLRCSDFDQALKQAALRVSQRIQNAEMVSAGKRQKIGESVVSVLEKLQALRLQLRQFRRTIGGEKGLADERQIRRAQRLDFLL